MTKAKSRTERAEGKGDEATHFVDKPRTSDTQVEEPAARAGQHEGRPPLARERAAKLTTAFDRASSVQRLLEEMVRVLVQRTAPEALQDAACAVIDRAWRGTVGHDIETWRRVELMAAVDLAAKSDERADDSETAALASMPPDVAILVELHGALLRAVVVEWRKPPRRRGRLRKGEARAPDRWDLLAELWSKAGQGETEPGTWKTDWRHAGSRR